MRKVFEGLALDCVAEENGMGQERGLGMCCAVVRRGEW